MGTWGHGVEANDRVDRATQYKDSFNKIIGLQEAFQGKPMKGKSIPSPHHGLDAPNLRAEGPDKTSSFSKNRD